MTSKPVPYPADTRAKGWRFELDYEKIDQSDTWDFAAEIPMCQPALLMMWYAAWRQTPCGSLPNDEAVIRVKCKLPSDVWAQCREILMRGWWLADDGRLYHDTIATRVQSMLDKRTKDAKRAADNRAKRAGFADSPPDVTRDTPVTPAAVPREFDTKHQAPSTKEEGIAKTGSADSSPSASQADANGVQTSQPDSCPQVAIVALFCEMLPSARQVRDWTPARQALLRARWREDAKRQSLDWWRRFFTYVGKSDFLMGRTASPNRRPFELGLDWLLESKHFIKVIEGAYHEAEREVAA